MKQNRTNLRSMGFVSTYPPTSCGLATFTAALRGAMADLRGSDVGLDVVSLAESRIDEPRPEVVYQHLNGDRSSLLTAVEILNTHEVALLQHEYGIYGGSDGAEVLDLVSNLRVPSIVTLHTVLSHPTPSQKGILEQLVAMSDETVVMSKTAATRLENRYDLDPAKISVVPHGATPNLAADTPIDRDSRPIVLTWGLIGPGKGLETAIEAFADLTDLDPLPRYVILGKTHPKVQAAHGDAYLDGLRDRAHALGLDQIVEFDGRYLDLETLSNEVRKADMVLLPYESTEQVTSGVLVEAIAAGKPVVATAFPHAVEMLSNGAGTVVPHSNPIAMSGALRAVLTNSASAERMARTARSIGATLYWPAVAGKYEAIASRLISRPPSVAALTDARKSKRQSDDLARVG